jgi:hypothetical protein
MQEWGGRGRLTAKRACGYIPRKGKRHREKALKNQTSLPFNNPEKESS